MPPQFIRNILKTVISGDSPLTTLDGPFLAPACQARIAKKCAVRPHYLILALRRDTGRRHAHELGSSHGNGKSVRAKRLCLRGDGGCNSASTHFGGNTLPRGAAGGMQSRRLPPVKVRGIDDSFSVLASSAHQHALHSSATEISLGTRGIAGPAVARSCYGK